MSGNKYDQGHQQERAAEKRQAGKTDFHQRNPPVGDAMHDEQGKTEGWRNRSDLQRDNHDYAEQDDVEIHMLHDRQENRDGQKHGRDRIEEQPADQQHHENYGEHDVDAEIETRRPFYQAAHGAGIGEDLAEGRRTDENDGRS